MFVIILERAIKTSRLGPKTPVSALTWRPRSRTSGSRCAMVTPSMTKPTVIGVHVDHKLALAETGT
jgi:hypothetical protein